MVGIEYILLLIILAAIQHKYLCNEMNFRRKLDDCEETIEREEKKNKRNRF